MGATIILTAVAVFGFIFLTYRFSVILLAIFAFMTLFALGESIKTPDPWTPLAFLFFIGLLIVGWVRVTTRKLKAPWYRNI